MVSPIGPVGSSASGVPSGRDRSASGALMVARGAAEPEVVATARESAAGGAVREVGPADNLLPTA